MQAAEFSSSFLTASKKNVSFAGFLRPPWSPGSGISFPRKPGSPEARKVWISLWSLRNLSRDSSLQKIEGLLIYLSHLSWRVFPSKILSSNHDFFLDTLPFSGCVHEHISIALTRNVKSKHWWSSGRSGKQASASRFCLCFPHKRRKIAIQARFEGKMVELVSSLVKINFETASLR